MSVTKEQVLNALRQVKDPASGQDIVASDIARAVSIEGDAVRFVLEVEAARGVSMEPVRLEAVEAVEKLAGGGRRAFRESSILLPWRRAKAGLGNQPFRQIWRWPWRGWGLRLACWMPIFTGRRSPG